MRKIIFLLLISLIVGASSCRSVNVEPVSGAFCSKNYVQVFVKGENFEGFYHNDVRAIQLVVTGDRITNHESPEFIALSNHFEDNSYNRKLVPYSNWAIANEFDGIEIISDKDFSDELPAGASLVGVVKLYGMSPIKYIESRYCEPFDWENNQPDEFKQGVWHEDRAFPGPWIGDYPVLKLVSEITVNDLRLLDPRNLYLRFTEIPAIKEHTVTVTLKYGERELIADVDVFFE